MISINLLGTPLVQIDTSPVIFPYKKAEALFYYLASEKTITRDEAALLLWEENDEATAKKNLRHALYVIKKAFNSEIIISPQKYLLSLNPEIQLSIDVDQLLSAPATDYVHASFLQGFGVKNADNYEDWLTNKRESIKKFYLNFLFKEITALPYENITAIEELSSKYMELDAFDERIYFYLMEALQSNQLYHKGIKVYQSLSSLTNKELGISPNKKVADLYHELLNEWSDSVTEDDIPETQKRENFHFQSYDTILGTLTQSLSHFGSCPPQNFIITGENGSGKTHLMNTFLEPLHALSDLFILNTCCYQSEKNFPLQPWNDLLFQLDDYISKHKLTIPLSFLQNVAQFFPTFGGVDGNYSAYTDDILFTCQYRACKNSIVRILQLISQNTRIMIVIDNIHLMDATSQDLLLGIVRLQRPNICLLGTSLCTMDYDTVTFLSTLSKEHLVESFTLPRLAESEVYDFLRSSLPEITLPPDTLEKIYKETEGNFFFLTEVIENLSENRTVSTLSLNAQGILNDRLNGISPEARHLLDIISIFHDFITLDTITIMHDKPDILLLDFLEELKEHSLIMETQGKHHTHFFYTQNRMREFVYQKLSPSKRKILHNKAGEALEKQMLKHNGTTLKCIYKQYLHAENTEKTLYYKILNLDKYSRINYELYPVLDTTLDDTIPFSGDVLKNYTELEQSLFTAKKNQPLFDKDDELLARLLHAKCRYCILSGLYDPALANLQRALNTAYAKANPIFQLMLMRQMVYYSIQVHALDTFDTYSKEGIQLSLTINCRIEHSFFHRLRGLYCIETGDDRLAIANLLKSIDSLEKADLSEPLYTTNIAAAYNYLGELHRRRCNYKDAINYYNIAIRLCKKNRCQIAPTIYSNLALAYFNSGNFKQSQHYFERSNELYLSTVALLNKPLTKCFLGYFASLNKEEEKAMHYINDAYEAATRLRSPFELGACKLIEAQVCQIYPNRFLYTQKHYEKEAGELLKDYHGTYIVFPNSTQPDPD